MMTMISLYLQELNQHPAFIKEFDPSKPMSPAMEALMALKYESDSAKGGIKFILKTSKI